MDNFWLQIANRQSVKAVWRKTFDIIIGDVGNTVREWNLAQREDRLHELKSYKEYLRAGDLSWNSKPGTPWTLTHDAKLAANFVDHWIVPLIKYTE